MVVQQLISIMECLDTNSMYITCQNKIRLAMWQEKSEVVKLYVFTVC